MAASGFVNRWNGKVLAKLLGLGASGMTLYSKSGNPNVSPSDFLAIQGCGNIAAPTTAALTINGFGVNGPLSSVGGSTYNLGAPVAGREVTIFSGVNGDGVRRVGTSLSGAFILSTLGSTSAFAINFSTVVAGTLVMQGLSTALWGVKSNVGPVTITTA